MICFISVFKQHQTKEKRITQFNSTSFKIGFLFRQPNNDLFMRHLYFLSFINKNKTFRDSNTISKSKCNIVMSEKINLKFFFEKT